MKVTILLGWVQALLALPVSAGLWEVKTPKGGSYVPPRPAISLQDHNTVFSTSAYCVFVPGNADTITAPAVYGLSRALCDECSSCAWKPRPGFTTELEWETAVTAEMNRLMGLIDLGDAEGEQQQVIGSWIAEAPDDMSIHVDTLDELSSSLGVALNNVAVSPASAGNSQRRFFVVSGTPRTVEGMLTAGFVSITPIPPRLKVHPILEEEAASEEEWQYGLYARLATPPSSSSSPYPPETSSTSCLSCNTTTVTSSPLPPLHGASSTPAAAGGGEMGPVGHRKVEEVIAGGGNKLTIDGVEGGSREEVYATALDLAVHGHVHWVGPKAPLTTSNYYASKLVQGWPEPLEAGGRLHDWKIGTPQLYELGIRGWGEVVGVSDIDSLDYGSCFFSDDAVEELTFKTVKRHGRKYDIYESKRHRKIRQYVIGHAEGYRGTINKKGDEHATLVSGSLVGNPRTSGHEMDSTKSLKVHNSGGVAPFAKIAFFEFPRDNGGDKYKKSSVLEKASKKLKPRYDGFMDYRKHVFSQAYSVGARVYSLSIGNNLRDYGFLAGSIDAFCFEHQDFVLLAAAGNAGAPNPNQEWPGGNIDYPAVAKNVVAVGSHLNLGSGHNSAHIRPDQLSVFSARGPTMDGRIKPDVCGPGEWVTSATSDPKAAPGSRSCETKYVSGTSYAAPIVAGVTVLVRQYFTLGYYPDGVGARKANEFQPMGALLKAVLVNRGRPVFKESPKELDTVRLPNNDMGWGGVDVSTTLVTPSSPEGQALMVFGEWSEGCADCPHLYGRDSCEYTFQVVKNRGLPLKVTLVWYDYPSEDTATHVTVNNLGLSITSPSLSDPVHPNGRTSPDILNTVEHIAIPSPAGGTTYTVTVEAGSIPVAPQPFALVISGPFDRDDVKVAYTPATKLSKKKKSKLGQCGGGGDGGGKPEQPTRKKKGNKKPELAPKSSSTPV